MTRRPTAVVTGCTPLKGGRWMVRMRPEGSREDIFATLSQDHPEGTRLTLVDGEWRKL